MSGKSGQIQDLPQGIFEGHHKAKEWHRHASPVSLIVLGALMVLAFSGFFGGQPHPTILSQTPSANIALQLPQRIRNGEFFEMRMNVETKRPVDDLTLAISWGYWHDLTINSMIPAPSEEKSENGYYLFAYGELDAGTKLAIKIDGQINPPLFRGNAGEIQLRDGDTVIAAVPVEMKVMP